MAAKVGMLFVLVMVVLMFDRSVNGHRQMIKSTKPKPPVKKGIARVMIAPTLPVNFKSIYIGEQRPSIQVLKQRKHGRVLTLSYYEYRTRPSFWRWGEYCKKVEELWIKEDWLSLQQLRLHLKW